jgi:excinuclease UvrABC nuclease subunit
MGGKVPAAPSGATRRSPVPEWVPAELPAAPGVYQFEADGGTALYVGKSVNLRRRVRGYFYGGGPRSERTAEMLALARRVEWRATGSDLEARLDEARRIVATRPVYNRALRNRARGWYLEIDWRDPFPRVRVVRAPRGGGARRFGPYRGRKAPERIARFLEHAFRLRSCGGRVIPDPAGSPCLAHGVGLCTAPCIAAVGLSAYRTQVEDAARWLGDPRYAIDLRASLAAERDVASGALAFEHAGELQRRIDRLDALEEERATLERPWVERSWMIALPHARPGRSVLIAMVRGRVLPAREVDWEEDDPEAVADACYAARVAELGAPSVLEPAELVPSLIVSGWLMDGAPGGVVLDLDRASDAEVVSRLAADPPVRSG